jgi:integrase
MRERKATPTLQPWTLHDLRRTCATGCARLGAAAHVVSKILGHRQGCVTAVYMRYTYLAEVREALDRWGEHVKGLKGTCS